MKIPKGLTFEKALALFPEETAKLRAAEQKVGIDRCAIYLSLMEVLTKGMGYSDFADRLREIREGMADTVAKGPSPLEKESR